MISCLLSTLALASALVIAGCAANNQGSLPSAQNTVYALKNTFASAQTAAIQYTSLPRCGQSTSPPLCSDAGVVAQIRKYNGDAVVALDAAEKTVRDPTASTGAMQAAIVGAQNAVTALQQILPTLNK